MKVKDIFAEENSLIQSVLFDNDDRDSLTLAYIELTDDEWLRTFFKEFERDLSYYPNQTIERAVELTKVDADILFNKLLEFSEKNQIANIEKLFKPLDNRENEEEKYDLQQLKAYGIDAPWIRLYVIRRGDAFVFTGGTIKLTKRMKDRTHTKHELYKLDIVKEYLIDQGESGDLGYIEIK